MKNIFLIYFILNSYCVFSQNIEALFSNDEYSIELVDNIGYIKNQIAFTNKVLNFLENYNQKEEIILFLGFDYKYIYEATKIDGYDFTSFNFPNEDKLVERTNLYNRLTKIGRKNDKIFLLGGDYWPDWRQFLFFQTLFPNYFNDGIMDNIDYLIRYHVNKDTNYYKSYYEIEKLIDEVESSDSIKQWDKFYLKSSLGKLIYSKKYIDKDWLSYVDSNFKKKITLYDESIFDVTKYNYEIQNVHLYTSEVIKIPKNRRRKNWKYRDLGGFMILIEEDTVLYFYDYYKNRFLPKKISKGDYVITI